MRSPASGQAPRRRRANAASRVARWLAPLLACGALLAGCATVKVRVEADPEHDFSAYETFAWLPAAAPPARADVARSPFLDARIRAAVERVLTQKGYRVAEPEAADLRVGYLLSFEHRYENPAPEPGYAYQWGYVVSVPRPGGFDVEQGTLVIDVAAAGDDGLVWRGWGSGRVLRRPTPERSTREIEAAVEEILARFPERP